MPRPTDHSADAISRRHACLRLTALLTAGASGFGLLGSGCGYVVGNQFPREVRSIHVPIFKNNTYRRGLEYQLTEAVQREIQQRTTFRLVSQDDADTVLTGAIVEARKDVLGQNKFSDPRSLQVNLQVRVTWEDRRSGRVLATDTQPIQPDAIALVGQADFAPEVGQSQATAVQEANARMARKIVDMMENPW